MWFIYQILQSCFIGTGATVRLTQHQQSNLENRRKSHNKTKQGPKGVHKSGVYYNLLYPVFDILNEYQETILKRYALSYNLQ